METKTYASKGELSKVLAVLLVEQGSYTYVDKIAQTTSRDLALYHIREALRDYNSLLTREFVNENAKSIADSIRFQEVEREIETISKVSSVSDLREIVSFISSQALAKAARIKSKNIYDTAVKIARYLKQKGMSFNKIGELENLIQSNKNEILKDLDIEENDVKNIIENKALLGSVVKREGE